MSLASTGLNLTHRCSIERDQNAGELDDGAVQPPDWQESSCDVRCRFWAPSGSEVVANGTSIVSLLSGRLIVPLATDVTDSDRVTSVTYRGGTVQAGPLEIRAVLPRKDHIELLLVQVG